MAGQPSGVAAFVEAFGNSYAQGYNRRVQAQLAQKNAQNAAIAETLVTSGAENPDLWQNQTFLKAANEVLGKDNAAAVAEAQIAHKQSGMGQLIDALRRIPTAAVSAEANGPGTGPSVPFNELNPVQQTQVARDRLKGISPVEAGLGFGTGVGQLQAQTQELATKPPLNANGMTPAQQAEFDRKTAKDKETATREEAKLDLLRQGETRRGKSTSAQIALGKLENLETPLGPIQVRTVYDPATQSLTQTPIARKRQPVPAAMIDKFQNLNTGLRYTNDISDFAEQHPAEAAGALAPFIGKKLSEINENIGTLTPGQQRFIRQLKNLAVARTSFQGGRALTQTEMDFYAGVLPSLNVANVDTLKLLTQDTREALTAIGADTENALDRFGYRLPPGAVTLQTSRNKDFYQHLRKRMPEFPTGVPTNIPPSASSADEAAVNDAFLAP